MIVCKGHSLLGDRPMNHCDCEETSRIQQLKRTGNHVNWRKTVWHVIYLKNPTPPYQQEQNVS